MARWNDEGPEPAQRTSGAWRIHVDDDGAPIPAGDRERAFQMFSRLGGRAGPGGAGMGLALCREIVERAGGAIWADASPLGGTRITFTIIDHKDSP